MLVCTLNESIINTSTINYTIWIVADGANTIDSINGSIFINVTTINVGIETIAYDFKFHYFAFKDQTPNNVTSGIALKVNTLPATMSPQSGYTIFYDTFMAANATIQVTSLSDSQAILYSVV